MLGHQWAAERGRAVLTDKMILSRTPSLSADRALVRPRWEVAKHWMARILTPTFALRPGGLLLAWAHRRDVGAYSTGWTVRLEARASAGSAPRACAGGGRAGRVGLLVTLVRVGCGTGDSADGATTGGLIVTAATDCGNDVALPDYAVRCGLRPAQPQPDGQAALLAYALQTRTTSEER